MSPLKIDKAQWIFIGGVVGAILAVIAVILVGVLICRYLNIYHCVRGFETKYFERKSILEGKPEKKQTQY